MNIFIILIVWSVKCSKITRIPFLLQEKLGQGFSYCSKYLQHEFTCFSKYHSTRYSLRILIALNTISMAFLVALITHSVDLFVNILTKCKLIVIEKKHVTVPLRRLNGDRKGLVQHYLYAHIYYPLCLLQDVLLWYLTQMGKYCTVNIIMIHLFDGTQKYIPSISFQIAHKMCTASVPCTLGDCSRFQMLRPCLELYSINHKHIV